MLKKRVRARKCIQQIVLKRKKVRRAVRKQASRIKDVQRYSPSLFRFVQKLKPPKPATALQKPPKIH